MAKRTSKALLTAIQKKELHSAWSAAVKIKRDSTAKALGATGNIEINCGKALEAIWSTVQVCATLGKILHLGTTSPEEILGLSIEAYAGVHAWIGTMFKKMSPLQFTAAVVLSHFPKGITEDDFKTQLNGFLKESRGLNLPWYLWLTKSRIATAKNALAQKGVFDETVRWLEKNRFLKREGEKCVFTPRNFTLTGK